MWKYDQMQEYNLVVIVWVGESTGAWVFFAWGSLKHGIETSETRERRRERVTGLGLVSCLGKRQFHRLWLLIGGSMLVPMTHWRSVKWWNKRKGPCFKAFTENWSYQSITSHTLSHKSVVSTLWLEMAVNKNDTEYVNIMPAVLEMKIKTDLEITEVVISFQWKIL